MKRNRNKRPRGVGALVTVKGSVASKIKNIHWHSSSGAIRVELEDGTMLLLEQSGFVTLAQSQRAAGKNRIQSIVPCDPTSHVTSDVNSYLKTFDIVVSVDATPSSLVEGRWVIAMTQVSFQNCMVHIRCPVVYDVLGMRGDPEKVGWRLAYEEIIGAPSYRADKRVALIVDAHRGDHERINSREAEILPGWILPAGFVVCYAKEDSATRDSVVQSAIRLADRVGRRFLEQVPASNVLMYRSARPGEPFMKVARVLIEDKSE